MILEDARQKKRERILTSLDDRDSLTNLKTLSIQMYGLVDNDIRKAVWPKLVPSDKLPDINPDLLISHPSRHQVELDTNRMGSLIPSDLSESEQLQIKEDVTRLIMTILVDNPSLYYYQGFHDICYIFYSVLGETKSREIINRLIPTHLSLFMQSTMDVTVDYMDLIFALLTHVHPKLLTNIEAVGLGPDFAISWIITWFAHVLPNMDDVRRLFDLFLAMDKLIVIYVSVSIIMHSDKEVQSAPNDFGLLYQTLAYLPKIHPVESLIRKTLQMYSQVPPNKLMQLHNDRALKRRELGGHSNMFFGGNNGGGLLWTNRRMMAAKRSIRNYSTIVGKHPKLVGSIGVLIFAIVIYVAFNRTF